MIPDSVPSVADCWALAQVRRWAASLVVAEVRPSEHWLVARWGLLAVR
jgi:hypothetical protein